MVLLMHGAKQYRSGRQLRTLQLQLSPCTTHHHRSYTILPRPYSHMHKLYHGNDMLSSGTKYTERTGVKNIQPDPKSDCTLYNHQEESKTSPGGCGYYNTDHQSSFQALTDTYHYKATRYFKLSYFPTFPYINTQPFLFSTYLNQE